MGSEGSSNASVVTQVSIGGFRREVRAIDLLNFLENEISGQVWRCRLKTSWTPPDSYPNFDISTDGIWPFEEYDRVEPHAFVHFASSSSVDFAFDASRRDALVFDGQCLKVDLGPENPYSLNQRRRTVIPFKLPNVHLEIGSLVTQDDFYVGWKGPPSGVHFFVDPFDGMCRFCFTRNTAFSFKDRTQCAVMKCDFKVEFLVRDILEIKQYSEISSLVILLRLASSPLLYYRTADDDIEENVPFDLLDDEDPWIRTTDFTTSGAIGRCNMLRVSLPPRHGKKLEKAIKYLRERRVHAVSLRRPLKIHDEPDYGMPLADVFFYIHSTEGIPFEVMFLLNSAVHKNILNQHQLSGDFFQLLKSQPKDLNVAALKHICTYKHPVFDACEVLRVVQQCIRRNSKYFISPKQLEDVAEVRRLVITPTKAYCLPPGVELSNRVLRKYRDASDRFLRVTFMDEGMQTMNVHILNYYAPPIVKKMTSTSFIQKTMIFKRMKAIMSDGFYLCGRKYSFLAFSSNQLRDRSAWFFAEDKEITVTKIIEWMGKFRDKNVAKCAARMGQCFSSTYATVEVPFNHVNRIPDINHNNYCFSDGIGKITPDLALQVAKKLKLDVNPPSAYQIRYAGFKGVVACWPGKDDGIKLSLRKSMDKFTSSHTMLEICSWTRFQPGFLNRQIITLLSTLNVEDQIFWNMQETMISNLNEMLLDPDVAFDVVTSSCADQGSTAAIMLSLGLKPQVEPHLRGMLTCIRAAQLWDLRERARIFVPSGRWLMGCLDELAVLEQGQCFIQVSNPAIENCFLMHGSRFSEAKKNLEVIKGYVVIAKNPCLHPGDIRILEAVDVPGLHHLSDCLVFPQKGDRPHTDEASGSDLDGDLYFVTWDENLIPPSKKSWTPMEYRPGTAKELPRKVNHKDIKDFFVQHILNENLGTICNAHVVHADRSEKGALDEKCLHLAELAAIAVDFPKTGKLATMPLQLKPKLYPNFMGKEEYQSYTSTKILGRLYRQIVDGYDQELDAGAELNCIPSNIPYDTSLEIFGSESFMLDAWDQKCYYDRQLSGLMGQYKVNREEEVVTGHVWSMPKYASRRQNDLKERLKHSYTALRKEFRQTFEKLDSNIDFEQLAEEERNLMYEQKASAWYQVTYHPKWVKKSLELQETDRRGNNTVMLSFAWIAADFIARIKIKKQKNEQIDVEKPINYLRRYVADRI